MVDWEGSLSAANQNNEPDSETDQKNNALLDPNSNDQVNPAADPSTDPKSTAEKDNANKSTDDQALEQTPPVVSAAPTCGYAGNLSCHEGCHQQAISDGNLTAEALSSSKSQSLLSTCKNQCKDTGQNCHYLTMAQIQNALQVAANQGDSPSNLNAGNTVNSGKTPAELCQEINDNIFEQGTHPRDVPGLLAEVEGCELSGGGSNRGYLARTAFEDEAGIPNPEQIKQLGEDCIRAQNGALKCCHNPLTCASEGELESSSGSDLALFGQLASGGLGLALQSGAINQSCKTLKTASNIAAAGNAAMGAFCAIRRSSCLNTCEKLKTQIETHMRKCNTAAKSLGLASAKHPIVCENTFSDLESAKAMLNKGNRRCDSLSVRIMENIAGAAQSALAAKLSDLCKKASDSNNDLIPFDFSSEIANRPVFNNDCGNPVNASNPLCQSCQLPQNKDQPKCKLLSNVRRPGADGGIVAPTNGKLGAFDLPPDINPTAQSPNFQNVEAQSVTSAGIRGGGTGGAPNSGSGGGGARRKGRSGGGGGSSTGSQFALPRRGSGGSFGGLYGNSGGFAGGSGSNKNRNKFNFNKLKNLKDYLPGGKKDPKRKTLGGALGLSRQIAGRSTNIWEKISGRYMNVCRMDRLYDCQIQIFAPKK